MIHPKRAVDEAEEMNLVLAGGRLDQAKVPEAGAGIKRVGDAWREEENLHVGRGYQGLGPSCKLWRIPSPPSTLPGGPPDARPSIPWGRCLPTAPGPAERERGVSESRP